MSGFRALAIAWWLATLSASLVAIGILIATRDTPLPASWGFRGAQELFALTCGTVGAIVALRRPGNLNGWLFCAIGVCFAAEALINEYVIAGLVAIPGGVPFTVELGWMLSWLWVPPLGIALIFLPLVFPTGHLLSRRWRLVAALGAVAITTFSAVMGFAPGPIRQIPFLDNPVGVAGVDPDSYSRLIAGPAAMPLAIAIALSLGSLVLRFQRASQDVRRQIKWFALATLVAGCTFAVYLTVAVLGMSPTAGRLIEVMVVLSLLGVPTTAGMAILRYRLYDIDRIVSRTISYGVLTTFLVAVFMVVNLALQGMLSSITSNNAWAVAGSTLLAAALFTPLRLRVQHLVDRRFNRARYDAEQTIAGFSERLRDEVDLPTLTSELDATVRRAIAPAGVGLWLRGGRR